MSFCPKCGTEVVENARFCPSCGSTMPRTASPTPQDPYIGCKLDDKFLIEELVGVGGMGRVYKATQLSLDKTVCVKVLRTGGMQDETLARRFHREARAASRLNHPNSITVIDFGQAADDGSLYLAMEYVPGKDLGKIIQQEYPLSERRVVHLIDQVLSALADAHAVGIVHRDLKPENIMVTDLRGTKDFVQVLDFGIAKIQESSAEPGLTTVGMVCGTPEYMSPEQARGEELDARSDLYSTGVILYQMVTGRLPFVAPTAMGIVTKHLTEPPVPPSQLQGVQASPALEAVVLKSMSKDRRGRQPTALAFQQELNAVLSQMVAPAQQAPEGQDLFAQPQAAASPARPQSVASGGRAASASVGSAATVIRPSAADVQPASQRGPAVEKPPKGKGWLIAAVSIALLVGGGLAAYFLWIAERGDAEPADAGVALAVDAGALAAADAGAQVAGTDRDQPRPEPDAGALARSPSSTDSDGPRAPAEAVTEPRVSDIARMHYQMGKELMAQRKYSKAIAAFQKAVTNSPGFAEAYKALGTCFISTGEIARAKKHLRLYLRRRPDAIDREDIQGMIDSL